MEEKPLRMPLDGQTRFVGDAHPIPPWPNGPAMPLQTKTNTRSYKLSLTAASGVLKPYFKDKPDDINPANDAEPRLHVPKSCYLELNLDTKWKWTFLPGDGGVMLGKSKLAGDRYFALNPDPGGQKVTFFAVYLDSPKRADTDPYNLSFLVHMELADGTSDPTPLLVVVDPDIKNPGDPPDVVGP